VYSKSVAAAGAVTQTMNNDLGASSDYSARPDAAEPRNLSLLEKTQLAAARRLQVAWHAHLVRTTLWRKKKVKTRASWRAQ